MLILGLFFWIHSLVFAQENSSHGVTVVCNFNTSNSQNNLGEKYGVWQKDETDESQFCHSEYVGDYDPILEKERRCLKLTYDVDSPVPAYNGLWMQLGYLDMTPYEYLVFYVKGDETLGYTNRFMLEIKNISGEVTKVLIQGVGMSWKKIKIPLLKLKGISDWTEMNEIVIVFDDRRVTKKTGAIFIDDFELVE